MRADWSFPRCYEVELDPDFPPAGGQLFFPGGGVATYRVALRVVPDEGDAWVGAFAGEGFGFSAVASTRGSGDALRRRAGHRLPRARDGPREVGTGRLLPDP